MHRELGRLFGFRKRQMWLGIFLLFSPDNLMDSGIGQVYHHVESGEFAGAGLSGTWLPDPSYEAFETNTLDWMNVAARQEIISYLGLSELYDKYSNANARIFAVQSYFVHRKDETLVFENFDSTHKFEFELK